MKKYKCSEHRFFVASALILFLVILLFVSVIIRMEYKNYQDKVEILYKMLSGDDAVQNAAGILKDSVDMSTAEGKQILENYGYQSDQNGIFQVYKSRSVQIVAISLALYLASLFTIWTLYRREKRKRQTEIRKLNEILSDFRKEIYNIQDTPSFDFDKELEVLYSEILSLGDYLRLMDERVHIEKEGTKSLVTDISHQLKTPVAALKSSFEILQLEDLTNEEQAEFSNRCSLQIQGIENLLSALINISRLETGIIDIKRENQPIFETILCAVNRVYARAEEKRIQIEMEAEDELQELRLPHDEKWFSEAIINILDNAVKYSPSDTYIMIRMIKRTTFLRIEVADEGIGIPKSDHNRVFKRFYRGNLKEVKEQTGSGVGLYLTREIITRHNGTINVSTRKSGAGSVFTIQLPYKL